MAVLIRTAEASDAALWRAMWGAYLDDYGVVLDPAITARTWARILDPGDRMACRIAWDAGRAVGFAVHHHHCSSWVAGDDLYLEDLFVAPDARRRGVGRALIDDLMALGRQNGWHRLYWNTRRDNATARRLYDSVTQEDGHIRYRLTL